MYNKKIFAEKFKKLNSPLAPKMEDSKLMKNYLNKSQLAKSLLDKRLAALEYMQHQASDKLILQEDNKILEVLKDKVEQGELTKEHLDKEVSDLQNLNITLKDDRINEMEKNNKPKVNVEQYMELFNDSLFDEAFILLEKNINEINDKIEKNKHIREFFGFIFNEDYFNILLDNNKLLPMSSSFVKHIVEIDVLKDMGLKLGNFVDPDMISIMFSLLLQNNEFEKAQFLTAFFEPNIMTFPKTISEIITRNNIEALKYVCENMSNIHYNEGSLLRLAAGMDTKALQLLIEKYDFDINEQSRETGDNILTVLLKNKNIKNFKFLVNNYGDKINFGIALNKNKKTPYLFDMIDSLGLQEDVYKILLNDLTLKTIYVDRIAKSLFSNTNVISSCINSDIYEFLFSHPNFDHQSFNLGQRYFIYGLISQIGQSALTEDTEQTEVYIKVLESFLNNHPEDNIPETTEYNIVGAAIWIAKTVSESATANKENIKAVINAVGLIVRRFPQCVIMQNPNGQFPIEQIEKDSPIARILVTYGATPLEDELGFWGNIVSKVKGQKKPVQLLGIAKQAERESQVIGVQNNPIPELRSQMRDDFKEMRILIGNPLCDPSIKFKCENMFLSADKLAKMMEKHKMVNMYDELHFLSENFSNYLKKSLSYYLDVCSTTADFAAINKIEAKLEAAKNQCVEQVDLLREQVDLISENVFSDVENAAQTNLRVQKRFLTEKFENLTRNVIVDEILKDHTDAVDISTDDSQTFNPFKFKKTQSENSGLNKVDISTSLIDSIEALAESKENQQETKPKIKL
jgi:hypothetical protein